MEILNATIPYWRKQPNLLNLFLGASLLITLYVFSALFGLNMNSTNNLATLIWAPTGLSLAALFFLGIRLWPVVFLAAFAVNVFSNAHPLSAIIIAAGNALEAVVGAHLLRTWEKFDPALPSLKSFCIFIFLGAVASTPISATFGTAAIGLFQESPQYSLFRTWLVWWFGDFMGYLLIGAPLLILGAEGEKISKWFHPSRMVKNIFTLRFVEGLAICLCIALTTFLVFFWQKENPLKGPFKLYTFFALTPWVATRFTQKGAALYLFVTAILILLATSFGWGPFYRMDPFLRILQSQFFLLVLSITSLSTAALFQELQNSKEKLRQNHDLLGIKVEERTKDLQEANLQLKQRQTQLYEAQKLAKLGNWEWDYGTHEFTCSEELHKIFETDPQRPIRQDGLLPLIHPADREKVRKLLYKENPQGLCEFTFEFRVRGQNFPTEKTVHGMGKTFFDHLGRPKKIIGTGQDITERKKMDEALEKSRQELESRVIGRTRELAMANTALLQKIGDHLQAEKDLQHSKKLLDTILAGITEGITLLSSKGKIIYSNLAAAKMVGLPSPQELLIATSTLLQEKIDLFDDENHPLPLKEFLHPTLVSPGKRIVALHWKNTGKKNWMEIHTVPVPGEGGPTGDDTSVAKAPGPAFIRLWNDVTQIKESEKHYKFLGEATSFLASSLDYKKNLQLLAEISVPFLADGVLIDILEKEENGKDFSLQRLAVIPPQDLQEGISWEGLFPTNLSSAFGPGKVFQTGRPETILLGPLSEWAPSSGNCPRHLWRKIGLKEVMMKPLKARGQTFGVITFLAREGGHHFTHHERNLIVELVQRTSLSVDNSLLYREAQMAVKIREEFLSLASHELKTPLTSLHLQLQILKRSLNKQMDALTPLLGFGPIPPHVVSAGKALQMLGSCENQSKRLAQLIEDLLDVTRIKQGTMDLGREKINLVSVAQEVVGRFTVEASLVGGPIGLSFKDRVEGQWDRGRIEQVITNLVSNALKYGDGKPITVSVDNSENAGRIMVNDQGPGVPPEMRHLIFQQFKRGTIDRHQSGLGLGLYISKQIVEAHGGKIWCEGSPGQGSSFIVELPLHGPQ